MKKVFYAANVLAVIGWLSFCLACGFAVTSLAGPVAGIIAGILSLFFTYSGLLLYKNIQDETFGCMVVVAFVVWLIISAWSISVYLATLMTTGWATLFAILIVVAWILVLYVRMVTKGK